MRKIFSKKLLIVSLSALLLIGTYKLLQACCGSEFFIGGTCNISPEAFVQDSTYYPFFYTDLFYYDSYRDDKHNERFNKTNVEEWDTYFKQSVDPATLSSLLYKAPEKQIRTMLRQTSNDKMKNFLQYMLLARQAEKFSTGKCYYPWEDKPKAPNVNQFQTFQEGVKAGFASSKNAFLKERYWFQYVRFGFFYNRSEAVSLFEKYKTNFPKNNMFYRTMAYAAGAYYKQQQYAKANYYYSLVFRNDKQLRTVAHWSFHPQEESDWQETLDLCQSPEEKATLWQMLGTFYGDELRSMKEIYKIAPQSPTLDLLLTRYANKYEDIGIFQEERKELDSIRNSKVNDVAWIQSVANEGKVSNPFLWNATAGYIAYLQKNYTLADNYYQKAKNVLPKNNKLASEQLRLLTLINHVGALNGITANDENALLPDLKWFFTDKNKSSALRYVRATNWIRSAMSEKYAKQGDVEKSECFKTTKAFYTNPENVSEYRHFLEKNDYAPYEFFCKQITEIGLNDVYEFQAVMETLKDGDFNQARELFIKSKSKIVLRGNPFNGFIKDCHDCDHAMKQKVKYTKASFLQTLILMRNNVQNGTDVYNNALLLGNAYYNITFYGNARYFYQCDVIDYGSSHPLSIDSHFRRMLTDNTLAYKYYQIALNAAQTDEQRAKCYYLMAKCERNKWYNQTFCTFENNDYYCPDYRNLPDFKEWDSFKKLKEYSNTNYYKDVVKECGYFRKTLH